MNFETELFWASLDFLNLERIALLQKHFGSLEQARKNLKKEELLRAGIPERSALSLVKKLEELRFEKVETDFAKSGAKLLYFQNADFPEALKNMPDPPIFLFMKGEVSPEDRIALAIVGTRRASAHGRQAVAHFVPELVRSGFTIVSGMARGIDATAHTEALKCGGRTIAIWGTGIDVIYPQENVRLAQEISQHGAILSEFPLGTGAEAYNFPRRNRLIAGLTLGTLVVEGEEKSGSLITALLALEQNKEVFAVPGSPFAKYSAGPNLLIQRGEAKLVKTAEDILQEFSFVKKLSAEPRTFTPENELEKLLFDTLTKEPMAFDELVRKIDKPGFELSSALMLMALRGIVTDLGMNQWARNF